MQNRILEHQRTSASRLGEGTAGVATGHTIRCRQRLRVRQPDHGWEETAELRFGGTGLSSSQVYRSRVGTDGLARSTPQLSHVVGGTENRPGSAAGFDAAFDGGDDVGRLRSRRARFESGSQLRRSEGTFAVTPLNGLLMDCGGL